MSISKRESRVLPGVVVFFLLNNALFNEEIGGEGGENCHAEREGGEELQIRETILMVAGLIRESSLLMRWGTNKRAEVSRNCASCFTYRCCAISKN